MISRCGAISFLSGWMVSGSRETLAEAYRLGGEEFAGHRRAVAVWAGDDGITVACNETLAGGRERAEVIRLTSAGHPVWTRAFANAAGRALAAEPGAGSVIVGEGWDGDMEITPRVWRLDAGGEPLDTCRPIMTSPAGLTAVARLADGRFAAGGAEQGAAILLPLQGGGQPRRLGEGEVTGLAPTPDGGLLLSLIAGRSTTGPGEGRIMALDAQLSERWSQVLGDGETTVEAAAVAARPDGGAVAAGHGPAPSGGSDLLHAAALADDGRIVWNRAVGEGRGPWRARHVVVARAVPDNRASCAVIVAGDSSRSPNDAQRGALVAALDADSGTPLWELELRGGETIAYGLAATLDGGALVAGSTATAGGRSEACLWRLAKDGSVDWTRRLTADNDS